MALQVSEAWVQTPPFPEKWVVGLGYSGEDGGFHEDVLADSPDLSPLASRPGNSEGGGGNVRTSEN